MVVNMNPNQSIVLFELLLGLLGIVHFAIVYTYFPENLSRGFITATLMVLTAVILFMIGGRHANH